MRTSTSDDYLTAGISYAFHPHRDTWYSAPFSQLNWWIPIYPVVPENVMAFHPQYWNNPVRNGSRRYNYYEWNRTSRLSAAQHIKTDTRDQPKPEEPVQLDPQVRVVPEAGGVMLFSGNQLHSTVPNTSGRTRFSIDFRTVNLDDVLLRREAPNVDSECTGTSLRDFLRAQGFRADRRRCRAQLRRIDACGWMIRSGSSRRCRGYGGTAQLGCRRFVGWRFWASTPSPFLNMSPRDGNWGSSLRWRSPQRVLHDYEFSRSWCKTTYIILHCSRKILRRSIRSLTGESNSGLEPAGNPTTTPRSV